MGWEFFVCFTKRVPESRWFGATPRSSPGFGVSGFRVLGFVVKGFRVLMSGWRIHVLFFCV